ncbi:zinc finger CCCH domain-containing protein 18-like [Thrips palmi]|uniref:Zinc finger CCCH domain-containing protein 18-like n=1 Tax=Thrips palmi TaxID=161013 RepID=A0A6P8YRK7_THRPL|nr:zinc finger CCCH domain-containing protein 18-like [Thrips palmi]XP_034239985.1 zinc finger CCCH domain-containing protein 18-like [Thrips palmi]
MDSENSLDGVDGELNAGSRGYASSDEEKILNYDTKAQKAPQSPPDSPPGSPPGSPGQDSTLNSHSSGSPQRNSPPSSPSEMRRSESKSPSPQRRSPVGSPSRGSPSGSPSRRSPSGSPSRGSLSRSPTRRSPSGSPSRDSPSKTPPGSPKYPLTKKPSSPGSPRSEDAPTRSSPSHQSSKFKQSPSLQMHDNRQERGSYSRRSHGKKSKRRTDGNASDGSDDGRSNISSSSSYSDAAEAKKNSAHLENGDKSERGKFEPHKADDLSDVSDLDSAAGDGSLDSLSDDEASRRKKTKDEVKKAPSPITHTSSIRKDIVSHSDEMEQLDFEAEEPQAKEDKEDGECPEAVRRPESSAAKSEADDGEVKNDEVEEGEITDEDENRPEETEPRPICRFYNRGQCTWGSSCRFLHPGVTDKGNYTMFDMVRPLVPTNGPPMYGPGPMVDYRAPLERPMMAPVGPMYSARKEEAPALESAWERGLRTAKEMMRKASKRKETDMDFEEKKMNLSLGQDELDKENDYYTRPASPALDEDLERWSEKDPESKHHRMVVSDRYEMDPYYGHHREGRERWARGQYDDARPGYPREHVYDSRHPGSHHDSHAAYRAHIHPSAHHEASYYPDKYERKKKSHTVREVIVQHTRKSSRAEEKSSSAPHRGGRGDEWADPWMRSKSPTSNRKSRPTRRQSYSSGSSYSSSRSSRSSYSSYYSRSGSRSRSRSRSKSRSASGSRSRSRSPPHPPPSLRRTGAGRGGGGGARGSGGSPGQARRDQRRPAPDPRASRGSRAAASTPDPEKRPAAGSRKPRPPSPGGARKPGANSGSTAGPGRLAGKVRHSKSSRSSSSDSSGSSSDSSETSLSSSSSSRDPTPPPKPKKIQMDERLMAQSTKIKAMDALKLSGQKQQIKLTLKTPGSGPAGVPDDPRRSSVVAGKKRTAETPPPPETAKSTAAAKPPVKKTAARREELLKQLKAVEDAIARKRSKIT